MTQGSSLAFLLLPAVGFCFGASLAAMYIELKVMERQGWFDDPTE